MTRKSYMSPEEEYDLIYKYQKGSREDRLHISSQLVKAFDPYIKYCARNFFGSLGMSTAINIASLGFVKSLDKIDLKRKRVRLTTVSHLWMRQELLIAINREMNVVKLPTNLPWDKRGDLKPKIVTNPSSDNGLDIIQSYKKSNLEGRASDTNDVSYTSNMKLDVHTIVSKMLWGRDKQIVVSYFGLDGSPGKTLQEVGIDCNIARERVRQLLDQALLKLEPHLKAYKNLFG